MKIFIFAQNVCTAGLMLLIGSSAYAATLSVHCGAKTGFTTIGAALKALKSSEVQGPATINVSGTCTENILIQSFDRLTLITTTGATIDDASGGQNPVVDIEDSHGVTIQGFHILGGADGVICGLASVCSLTGNIVEGSTSQEGVAVGGGSKAFLSGNTIRNNSQRGLSVTNNSQVRSVSDTFKGNGDGGVVANSGAYFGSFSSIVQNNGSDGIVVSDHSTARFISGTISGNAGNGVTLQHDSEARFDSYSGAITVTANGASGVSVSDLSFGLFSAGASIAGNLGGTDVVCAPQFPATRGALTNIGGGKTNCVEP
jgi:hypothetical protein